MCASLHSNVMSEADFARYLQQAETCLNEARQAAREVDKAAWLETGWSWQPKLNGHWLPAGSAKIKTEFKLRNQARRTRLASRF
jgi:hypothetical protein